MFGFRKYEFKRLFSCLDPLYLLIPAALLLSAVLIWLFSGEAVLVLSSVKNTGIFPGRFLYAFGYVVRLAMSGIITACTLTGYRSPGYAPLIASSVLSLLLLTEYKLIFVSVRLFSSFVISCACAALSLFLLLKWGKREKAAFVITVSFSALQIFFCLQTASLILGV